MRAVNDVLGPALEGLDATAQRAIDAALVEIDGTPNKGNLGANAILGVSLAVARAAASSLSLPLFRYLGGPSASTLPVPMMNVVNGGKHAEGALQFQECMIVPLGARSEAEAVRCGAEVFHALGRLLHDRHLADAGRRRGRIRAAARDAATGARLHRGRDRSRGLHEPAADVAIALDPASSEFYQDGKYYALSKERGLERERDGRVVSRSCASAIRSSRSKTGLPKTIGRAGAKLTEALGDRVQLVGDDIFVTNVAFLRARNRRRRRQLDPRQGQSDRHA